jgi:hypothetical protein
MFTMPAAYQLFPHDGAAFVDAAGRPVDVDLYDAANWERYGWAIFQPGRQEAVRRRLVQRDSVDGAARYQQQQDTQRRFLAAVLRRADRFHLALRQGDPEEERQQIRYVVMGAGCEPTLQRAVLEPAGDGWQTRFKSRDAALQRTLYGYGDHSVTKESLLGEVPADSEPGATYRLPGAQAMFFCEGHGGLPRSITFMDNVLHTLIDEE